MAIARVRNAGSSLTWYFSWQALTDSASIRAWAGSYTPHGRSQWAKATAGARNRSTRERTRGTMRIVKLLVSGGLLATLVRLLLLKTTRVEVVGHSMWPTLE